MAETSFKRRGKGRGNVRKKRVLDEQEPAGSSGVLLDATDAKGAVAKKAKSIFAVEDRKVAEEKHVEQSSRSAIHSEGESAHVLVNLSEEQRAALGIGQRKDLEGVEMDGEEAERMIAQRAAQAKQGQEVYTGAKDYLRYKKQRESARQQNSSTGPLRAESYQRTITIIDYKPDICKDYMETGYCGYGDNCKFLHVRGEWKTGLDLDREWENEQKKKAEMLEKKLKGLEEGDEGDHESEAPSLPFACYVCRKPFSDPGTTEPVVTKCKHYFCRSCALQRYKTNSKCAACNKETYGVFNIAKDVMKQVKEERKRAKMADVAGAVSGEASA